jgi:predicted enzyme related to lactoylglutathione lyase
MAEARLVLNHAALLASGEIRKALWASRALESKKAIAVNSGIACEHFVHLLAAHAFHRITPKAFYFSDDTHPNSLPVCGYFTNCPCQAKGSSMELNQVTLPATDVEASVSFYQKMGFELVVHSPHYARFKSTIGGATFSVHAMDALKEPSKTVLYFECPALDQQVATLKAKGLEFTQEPRDEPWLWREARLTDPAGNIICLYHAGENRLNPPWRVKN